MCAGWLARFSGVTTIHAVLDFVQNHPASGVQEPSVQRLADQLSDSHAWPYPSSLVFLRLGIRIEVLLCLSLFDHFFCLSDHQAKSSSDHHSGSCACSSPKNALSVLLDRPLPFPFPFPFLFLPGGPSMVWHTHCRTMSKNTIFHHQCSLARQSLHLWPIVQIRLQRSLPR